MQRRHWDVDPFWEEANGVQSLIHVGVGTAVYRPCVFLKPENIIIGENCRIDAFVKIEGGYGVDIGDFVHIASESVLNNGGGKLTFGSHSGCAAGTIISSGFPDVEYRLICPMEPTERRATIYRHTIIGEYVLILSGAIISPGVIIGDGAVVRAGAVVTKNVEPYTIVQGNPARVVGVRTIKKE